MYELPTELRIYIWSENSSLKCEAKMELYWTSVDLLPNEQNFDLDKSRQKFYHSLKEHRKISNIPKFRCEML